MMPLRSLPPPHPAAHRLLAVLLLPLVLLGGFSAPGGWFCADGSQCRPAVALACCCEHGERGPVPDDCCADEGGAETASISGPPCGCYYHAGAVEALRRASYVLEAAVAFPAVAFFAGPEPPARNLLPFPPVATGSPPRYLVSPSDTRGPPVA